MLSVSLFVKSVNSLTVHFPQLTDMNNESLKINTSEFTSKIQFNSPGNATATGIFKIPLNILIRLGFRPPQPSVSKFPPIVEFVLQRIQAHNSVYIYEDLSRPPTWDSPYYATSTEKPTTEAVKPEQEINNDTNINYEKINATTESTIEQNVLEVIYVNIKPSAVTEHFNSNNVTEVEDYDYELQENSTNIELLFEKIPENEKDKIIISKSDMISNSDDESD